MNRLSLIVCLVVCGAAALVVVAGRAQSGAADALVRLQPGSPGVQQIGNTHVSGASLAGQFVGGGAGLTSVNADLLDGMNSTAFLQSIPVPLTLTGTSATHIIRGENVSSNNNSSGVFGTSTGASGNTYGGRFESASSNGTGVFGTGGFHGGWFETTSTVGSAVLAVATAGSGNAFGLWATSSSPTGTGLYAAGSTGALIQSGSTSGIAVLGQASAASGSTYGGRFESTSTTGTGVYGSGGLHGGWFETTSTGGSAVLASAPVGGFGVFASGNNLTGIGILGSGATGVIGQSPSTAGIGIHGQASAVSGTTYGGRFENASTSGRGVYGEATATSGFSYGGRFENASSDGRGILGNATANTGFAFGVEGRSSSTDGRGVFGAAPAASGQTFGGYFNSFSTSGRAVFGWASANSGTNYAGFFQTSSPAGLGGNFTNIGLGAAFDVELSGPNGAINTPGFLYREYTATTRSAAIPIAYGSVSAAGVINGGTGNFTVTHTVTGNYDITISGEVYSNNSFATTITPVALTPWITAVADVGTPFRVSMWNATAGAVLADNAFHFTVWKSDPSEPGDGGYASPPEDNGGSGRKTFKRPVKGEPPIDPR